MKHSILIFALLAPVGLALAADKPLVRVPVSADPTALQQAGFELYGQSPRYLIGALPVKAKLPSGAQVLDGYSAEGGDLFLLTKLSPEDGSKLTAHVRVLYTEGDEALIQGTYEQTKRLPTTRAEWLWITTELKLPVFPETYSLPAGIDEFDPMVPGMVAQVSQTQYTQYLQTLQDFITRASYHPNCDSAAAWILAQFQSFGLEAYYDTFPLPGGTIRHNVVGELQGWLYPDSVLFITAHHDATVGAQMSPEPIAPGADDNGSGTACVLECARILSQYNFAKTLRFVTFAGEEQGLVGSYYYTNHLQAAGTNVVGAFNYDMIAYPGFGQPPYQLVIVSDNNPFSQAMAAKISEAATTFVPQSVFPITFSSPNFSGSDHYRFWQKGWAATMTIHAADYPFYHTVEDLISNCDMPFAANVTRAALAALADFADPIGGVAPISGAVYGTWTAAGNPYIVGDTIYVPPDSTLTLQPGVMVFFEGHHTLEIRQNATLKALGTSSAPVNFIPPDHTTGWAGLRFLNASDSSRLEFCLLSYAINNGSQGGAIYCDNTSLTLDHVLMHHCQAGSGGALALVNQSNPILNLTTLASNSATQGAGIYCENSSPVISNSILWDAELEIVTTGSSNPQVNWCDVFGGYSGTGNLNADPLFVGTGNFHLQSVVGSYSGGNWFQNPANSPCIDQADPAAPWNLEPEPNGNRADMGSYGNTPQASLSQFDPQYAFGAVSGIWTAANDTIHVIGNVFVPSGDTLVIEPGVEVIFEGHYQFTVQNNALLIAQGTFTDSISFTPSNPASGWAGLRFDNAYDSCRLVFCRISNARVGNSDGGGIRCDTTSLSIRNCLIDSCRAGNGGGLYALGSTVQIVGSLFAEDSAITGGGALYAKNSQLFVQNSRFLNNNATNGAAVYLWFSQAQISNTVFAQDTATGFGPAIYAFISPVNLTNCTVAANQANPGGTSGAVHALGASPLTITNSIFWNNSPQQIGLAGATATVEYSDVMNGWTGTGNLDVNPLFESGPFSAWQLASTSPVVDQGNPGSEYNDPEDPANPGHALYPALGFVFNDMGAYGGPQTSGFLGVPPMPEEIMLPQEFGLSQNRPNPFNPVTTISYELRTASFVNLKVYDLSGRLVKTLVEGFKPAGRYSVTFDPTGAGGSRLASGMYFVQMKAGDFVAVKKMVLLK